jgi:hypothetical protein
MNALRTLASIILLAFASLCMAQAPAASDADAPKAPGARDGSRPSDGAITGGSIAPGESSGVPNSGTGASTPSDRAVNRCNDLSGTLREQCLLQERGASTGGTRAPETGVAKQPSPREAPPPQNPRP